jgi:hypothetical protein
MSSEDIETETDAESREVRQPTGGKGDRLNRWLTLGANLGVVLGLIILIVELRQNATLTRADMKSRRNDVLVQIELSLAQSEIAKAWVRSIRAPETMTDVDVRIVESHLVALMLQWDYMFEMEDAGLVTREDATEHIQNTAPYYFGSRHAKNWWHWQEAGWGGNPMMEVAGPIVEGVDEDFMLRYLEGTRLGKPLEDRAGASDIEREGRRFMENYGKDLRSHDRSALAARYAPSGATILFNGVPIPGSFEDIAARYRDEWTGPTDFAWNDLFFDVVGPDSVVVTGTFDWGTPDGRERYTYANILQRHDGEFRIRREVETRLPAQGGGPP